MVSEGESGEREGERGRLSKEEEGERYRERWEKGIERGIERDRERERGREKEREREGERGREREREGREREAERLVLFNLSVSAYSTANENLSKINKKNLKFQQENLIVIKSFLLKLNYISYINVQK